MDYFGTDDVGYTSDSEHPEENRGRRRGLLAYVESEQKRKLLNRNKENNDGPRTADIENVQDNGGVDMHDRFFNALFPHRCQSCSAPIIRQLSEEVTRDGFARDICVPCRIQLTDFRRMVGGTIQAHARMKKLRSLDAGEQEKKLIPEMRNLNITSRPANDGDDDARSSITHNKSGRSSNGNIKGKSGESAQADLTDSKNCVGKGKKVINAASSGGQRNEGNNVSIAKSGLRAPDMDSSSSDEGSNQVTRGKKKGKKFRGKKNHKKSGKKKH